MHLSFIPVDCVLGDNMWDTIQESISQAAKIHFIAANTATQPKGSWPQMMDHLKQEATIVRAYLGLRWKIFLGHRLDF